MPDLYRALEQLARSRETTVEELVEDTLVRLVERHHPLRIVGREGEDEFARAGTAKVIPLNARRGLGDRTAGRPAGDEDDESPS